MNEITKRILELKEEDGLSYREIGEILGLHKDCVRGRYRRYNDKINGRKYQRKDTKHQEQETNQFSKQESRDNCTISTKSFKIRTVEEALKYADIDMDIWEVDRVTINSWEVPRKDIKKSIKYDGKERFGDETDTGQFNTKTLWQVKVSLKRKIGFPVLDALKHITDTIRDNPPEMISINYQSVDNPHLLEISLVDHHFGKLCINGEGLKNSENLYLNAVDNLLKKVSNYNIEKIILPLGSDFFHIDNKENKTARGTPQDVDAHITEIFKTGCMAVVKSIYKMRQIAPVKVLYVPGNHDFMTSFYLSEFIRAWFNGDKSVEVDTNKLPRKYEIYGKTLIGYTHGNEERVNDLARLIMSENIGNKEISNVEYFEYHKGHYHRKKQMNYVNGDTIGNVKIVDLPSLCGTDFWHYTKGYVGAKRAAEAYIYNKEFGNIGHFVCDIREIS